MKSILFYICCLVSFGAFSQTYTFTKNQEIARFNEVQKTTSAMQSTFTTTAEIDDNYLSELASVMEYKDGYVQLVLVDSHTIRVLHENFIAMKDIIDVATFQNTTWTLLSNELSSFK